MPSLPNAFNSGNFFRFEICKPGLKELGIILENKVPSKSKLAKNVTQLNLFTQSNILKSNLFQYAKLNFYCKN